MSCCTIGNINSAAPAEGVHLIGDLYHCKSGLAALSDARLLRTTCLEFCRNAGLQIVGDAFHQFESSGATGCVLLAESHVAIHTWPELLSVTVDVYVCNYNGDNSAKARRVFDDIFNFFAPGNAITQNVQRNGARNEQRNINPDIA
jgi:S-adenosylmethionine decarboxylase proenzyme